MMHLLVVEPAPKLYLRQFYQKGSTFSVFPINTKTNSCRERLDSLKRARADSSCERLYFANRKPELDIVEAVFCPVHFELYPVHLLVASRREPFGVKAAV